MSFSFHHCLLCLLTSGTFDYSELADIEAFDFSDFESRVLLFLFQVHKQPPEVFCKKGVLRNFAKFTGKHLCQSFYFNKVAGEACKFGCHVFSDSVDIKFFRGPRGHMI